jgi:hypothetical protein
VRLLGLKKYNLGFVGMADDGACYRYFLLSRRRLKILHEYPGSDFQNYRHFVSVMGRLLSCSFFFPSPPTVAALTRDELERVHAETRED